MSSLEDPRVLFAAERTLLAWNRTSLGMVAFGFLVERAGLLEPAPSPLTFWLGLAFIAIGVVTALYSSRQYGAVLRTLTKQEFPAGYNPRWGMWVNQVVAFLGTGLIIGLYLARG